MSGIVNSTGAVSGIIGTTVGSVTAASLSGVLPVGVTGGSGLDAVPESITHFDQWRITTGFTGSSDFSSNWERVDAPTSFGYKGTAMSESSGIFTFPVTGFWQIFFFCRHYSSNSGNYANLSVLTTHNNSTYVAAAFASPMSGLAGGYRQMVMHTYIFDVTATATHKCKMNIGQSDTSNQVAADSDNQTTGMTFIRLAST